eukprot:TRINITY_DN63210_c0_g1_i5.p1 TRINITY_DN63210_c0_g1~~TRINITY_DN63210_c0_g1_i5.p1  ORF type:complete len:406 (-),score=23.07 TRINITY_DN63210_c0_g1_i5:78-1187(-)
MSELELNEKHKKIMQGVVSDSKGGYLSVLEVLSSLSQLGVHLCMDANICSSSNFRKLIQMANQNKNITLRVKLFISCTQQDVQRCFLEGKDRIESIDIFMSRTLIKGEFLRQLFQGNSVLKQIRFLAPHLSHNFGLWSDGVQGEIERNQVYQGISKLETVEWAINSVDTAKILVEIPFATSLSLYSMDLVRQNKLHCIHGLQKLALYERSSGYDIVLCEMLQQQLKMLPQLKDLKVLFVKIWKYIDLSILTNLTTLYIEITSWETMEDVDVQSLSFLQKLGNLTSLTLLVEGRLIIYNFDFLENLKKLRYLELGVVKLLKNTTDAVLSIRKLVNLEIVNLRASQESVQVIELGLMRAFPAQNVKYTVKQ